MPPQDVLSQQLYWLNKLSGYQPGPALFSRLGRHPGSSDSAGTLDFKLPPEVSARILRVSKGSDLSSYAALVSGLAILVGWYSTTSDVIVFSPALVRGKDAGPKGLLPLRIRISDRLSYIDFLRQVGRTIVEAYANQDCSPRQIAEAAGLTGVHGAPGLNISISLDSIHGAAPVEDGGKDLGLSFVVHGEEITGSLKYDGAQCDARAARNMVDHYQSILNDAFQNASTSLSRLALLADSKAIRLNRANDTGGLFPTDTTFDRLFSKQADKTPHRIAASCSGEFVSYGHLNAAANDMAKRLSTAGAGPEKVIALYAWRGIDFLTAMLGIFKTGAAYLPVDPSVPSVRSVNLVSQSRSHILLVSQDILFNTNDLLTDLQQSVEDLGRQDYPEVVILDNLTVEGAAANPYPGSCSESLAYVIFTSGSTGVPKGAMIEHRGMINHLCAKLTDLALGESDVVGQTASQTFDISVWQYLAPLLTGAMVCIVPDETAKNPLALAAAIEQERITILEAVPSLLQTMLDVTGSGIDGGSQQPSLRWLLCTGEALSPELSRQWLSRYPEIPLMNAYGPTECSDDVTHAVIDSVPGPDATIMPIGVEVSNMTAYVLDSRLRAVPPEFGGELSVSGIGVGRGYLDDPSRTAEVFLPDAYATEPGTRMYRTGDSARRRIDASLEFLGRRDHQVKIRGHRIELGEIEAELNKHPDVKQAVVMVRGSGGDTTRLAAYAMVRPGASLSAPELRGFLLSTVPDYMVPADFVFLTELPLTSNGKIDRALLSALEEPGGKREDRYVAPRNHLEQTLADIFAQVLGTERVGINDNFFESGGHSLSATRLVFAVGQAFDIDLPLQTLFMNADVERLARKVEEMLIQEVEELNEEQAAEWLSGHA
jgi:amino acid adenylation domain-containing protein